MLDHSTPLLDTNILYACFAREEGSFENAQKLVMQGCYLNDMIMSELTNLLANKHSYTIAHTIASFILESKTTFEFIGITHEIRLFAQEIQAKYKDSKLSFTDCVLLAQSQKTGLNLITKDQRMSVYPHATVTIA